MRALALLLPAALLLGSCGTPEYRAERTVCSAEWQQKIPPRYVQELVERVRYIRVPTGETICEQKGNKTHCVSGSRLEEIPYTAIETVDANKRERDAQIRLCAAKACTAKFGNAECKPAAAAVTP